jgi:DNA-directed RNA polymerase specialized sigma24 family protein
MGATEDFDRFYAATFPPLVGELALITGDLDVAGEVAQEALVQAAACWPQLCDDSTSDAKAWVNRMALQLAVSRRRRVGRRLAALLQLKPRSVRNVGPSRRIALSQGTSTRGASSEDENLTVEELRGMLRRLADESARSARPPGPAAARQRARWYQH